MRHFRLVFVLDLCLVCEQFLHVLEFSLDILLNVEEGDNFVYLTQLLLLILDHFLVFYLFNLFT